MIASVPLGPFALALGPLAFAASVLAGAAAARVLARGEAVEPLLWKLLGAALVAARLVYVWQWRAAYASSPWTLLDLRDGGWDGGAGLAAACLYALVLARRGPPLRRAIVAGVATSAVLWIGASIALAVSTEDGRPLPALELATLEGSRLALPALAGRPTAINLWATWCGPCRSEMPLLEQAQARYPRMRFVFVNQGETREQVQRFLRQQGLDLREVVLDPRYALGAAFGQDALPTTLFFDAGGRLVAIRTGTLSAASLAQRVEAVGGGDGPGGAGQAGPSADAPSVSRPRG